MAIKSFINQLQIVCKCFDQKTIKFNHSMCAQSKSIILL